MWKLGKEISEQTVEVERIRIRIVSST